MLACSSKIVFFALLFAPLFLGAPAAAQEAPAPAEETGHPASSILVEPGGGDHFWVFPEGPDELGSGGEFHVYVDPEIRPEARASFARFALGPGGALPVHRHDRTEEFTYFLSGEGFVQTMIDGELVELPVGEGHVWYVPPGAWHSIRNAGDEPLTLVFATVPNEEEGLLSFFRRIGVKPGEEATPLPPEEFARIAAEHDLVLRPPEEE